MSSLVPFQSDPRIYKAFEDYLAIGPERSVMALYRLYKQKFKDDPQSPIPSIDLAEISQWEAQYDWRTLAYQYDAEEHAQFMVHRRQIMNEALTIRNRIAQKLIAKAEAALDKMEKPEEQLCASDILKFLTEGTKILQDTAEKKVLLEDPKASGQGSGDFFDTLRKIVSVNLTQNNNYNYPE